MQILTVYAHPSENSFTREVRDVFMETLEAQGHTCLLSDLYAENFRSDMSEQEYLREAFYREELPIPEDVRREQEKIEASDAIAFIYPMFWTEAPAKLVGWFDRVWTVGYAYRAEGRGRMKTLEKALVLCVTGNTAEMLESQGRIASARNIMLDDRLHDRVREKDMVFLDATSRHQPEIREDSREKHLETVRALARAF